MTVEQKAIAPGIQLLALNGRLVLGRESQQFEKQVEELAKAGKLKLILDLSQVPYVDSAGLGALVGCNSKVKNAGGEMRLVGVEARVLQLLKLAFLDSIFAIDLTVADASKALGAS
jgi:anti-sigma B factor antagonist